MRGIAAIEVSAIVNELKDKFAGSYFKSFFELKEGVFLLVLNRERKPFNIYINLTKAVNETAFKEKADAPKQFTLGIRKRLEGMRVTCMSQHESDRIIVVDFEGRDSEMRLIIEMFDKGNLLLVNKQGLVEIAYASRSFRDRSVRRGALYAFPSSEALSLEEASAERIEGLVDRAKESEQKLISALSRHLNVGPMYLEDAIVKSGLSASIAAKEQKIDVKALSKEIVRILDAARKPEPRAYRKGEEDVDFAITGIGKYDSNPELKKLAFGTVSELMDHLYLSDRSTGINVEKSREVEQLTQSIATQKAQIERMRSESEEWKQVAGKIFARMGEINELLDEVRRRKVKTAEEMGGRFGNISIKGINPKKKTVTIELE